MVIVYTIKVSRQMPPQNEIDSLNFTNSESEYDSSNSSVEPDHMTSVSITSLPTSAWLVLSIY